MKTILVAINSKYIHTSLSVRSLKAYADKSSLSTDILEFTINNSRQHIISEIYKSTPDIICFSCYIWNIELIKSVSPTLKKILPHSKIILGGHEVSHDVESFMTQNSFADICVIGEGEETFKQLLENNFSNLHQIDGIAYRQDGQISVNAPRKSIELQDIPFVYQTEDIKNKLIYYETSRGCPFNCQYCMSSNDGVRFLPLERVYSDLCHFLKNRTPKIKLVDRTFNCNKKHCMAIWKFLIENDNGVSNFHFEIDASILDDEQLDLISTARRNLFQFEIGVQSTNPQTLNEIKRKNDLQKLSYVMERLNSFKNVHLHLDLIAGLPHESYKTFKSSFNFVYSLKPELLQLGFLKVLKGSGLWKNAQSLGLVFDHNPPYEILYTNAITYDELLKLKSIEHVLDLYSNKARQTLNIVIKYFESPFDFFEQLADYWEINNLFDKAHTKIEQYKILFDFLNQQIPQHHLVYSNFLKFDIYLNENIKNSIEWLKNEDDVGFKKAVRTLYEDKAFFSTYFSYLSDSTPRQLIKISHVEKFDINVLCPEFLEIIDTYVLFNYCKSSIDADFSYLSDNCSVHKLAFPRK